MLRPLSGVKKPTFPAVVTGRPPADLACTDLPDTGCPCHVGDGCEGASPIRRERRIMRCYGVAGSAEPHREAAGWCRLLAHGCWVKLRRERRHAWSGAQAASSRDSAPPLEATFVRRRTGHRAQATAARLDWVDLALVCIFLAGLYTNYTIMVSQKVPLPSAPSGVAGLVLLWRRRDLITPRALVGFCAIVTLYLISIFWATNITFLPRRTNGLIQLTYSLTIGYALFLTVTHASRRQIAGLFLGFALVIAVGCLLESHAGLRPLSDAVRKVIYSKGVYENDLRDLFFYNRVRPKFFASEPSSVIFCYALFSFIWLVVSTWRWKLPAYLALVGLGLFAMPGPTLLLMLVLLVPYLLFLDSRRNGRLDATRFLLVACAATLLLGVAAVLAQTLFKERLEAVTSGNDPSFFYRVQGPALAGVEILERYPIAGAGLTGEPFVERQSHQSLHAVALLLRRLADRLAVDRAPDQLFLAALDLPGIRLGRGHDRGPDGVAARAARAQPRLLLDGVGDPRPGVGRLCRPDLLGRAVSRRRRSGAARAMAMRSPDSHATAAPHAPGVPGPPRRPGIGLTNSALATAASPSSYRPVRRQRSASMSMEGFAT